MEIEILTIFVLSCLIFLFFHQNQKLMATQEELLKQLTGISAQLQKATQEIIDAIANSGNTTPEVDAAVENLKDIAQALDDLNPDDVES